MATEQSSLRAAAAAALLARREKEAAEAAKKAEHERKQLWYRNESRQRELREVFGIDVRLDPNSDEFEHDGLRFRWSGWDQTLQIQGECLACGAQTWSEDIRDLTDLGEMFETFTPEQNHLLGNCRQSGYDEDGEPLHASYEPVPPAPPSDLDQLRDLLRRILGIGEE